MFTLRNEIVGKEDLLWALEVYEEDTSFYTAAIKHLEY